MLRLLPQLDTLSPKECCLYFSKSQTLWEKATFPIPVCLLSPWDSGRMPATPHPSKHKDIYFSCFRVHFLFFLFRQALHLMFLEKSLLESPDIAQSGWWLSRQAAHHSSLTYEDPGLYVLMQDSLFPEFMVPLSCFTLFCWKTPLTFQEGCMGDMAFLFCFFRIFTSEIDSFILTLNDSSWKDL